MSKPARLVLTHRALADLVRPILPFAQPREFGFPMLAGVLIERRGAHVVAAATDRYRLGMKRVKPDRDQGESCSTAFRVLLPATALRKALTLFQPLKRYAPPLPTISITLRNGRAEIAGNQLRDYASLRLEYEPLDDDGYPPLHKLLGGALEARDEERVDAFALNPELIAAVERPDGGHGAVDILPGGRADKPLVFASGDDFVGMLMPMRFAGRGMTTPTGHAIRDELVASWNPTLNPPPATGRTRKAAKK